MKKNHLVEMLANVHKGANIRLSWKRDAKTRVGTAAHIEKATEFCGRIGIDYANLAVNADKETGELPWGQWEMFPFTITHKGRTYLRIYGGSDNRHVPTVTWYKNGRVVSKDVVAADLLASEKTVRESDAPAVITVNVEDIISIGVG